MIRDVGKTLEYVLDFSRNLVDELNRLSRLEEVNIKHLESHIAGHLQRIQQRPSCFAVLDQENNNKLAAEATKIWNLCITIQMIGAGLPEHRVLKLVVSPSMQFAVDLFDTARPMTNEQTRDGALDIVRLRLKLSSLSLSDRSLDLETARTSLQRAAEYTQIWSSSNADADALAAVFEYSVLRIVLCWKEDRLDVADHLYRNILHQLDYDISTSLIESLCDVLFRLGASILKHSDYYLAVKWLRRANTILKTVESLSTNGFELRAAVTQYLIYGLIKAGTKDFLNEASELISTKKGNQPSILSARLDIINRSSAGSFDPAAYVGVLGQYIATQEPSPHVIDSIIHYIYQLAVLDIHRALSVFDEQLFPRLMKDVYPSVIGKAIVQRLIMTTTYIKDQAAAIESSTLFLDGILQSIGRSSVKDYSGAVYMVLWKKIQSLDQDTEHELASLWCRLAHHPLLSNADETQRIWFLRKQLSIAICVGNIPNCYELYDGLTKISKEDILVQYLMFRVSLEDMNGDLCEESIKGILHHPRKDQVRLILYACARDAQNAGNEIYLLLIFQGLIRNMVEEQDDLHHLASLARSAIRLAVSINQKYKDKRDTNLMLSNQDDLSDLFQEIATAVCKESETRGASLADDELDWFRNHAYSLGILNCDTCQASSLISLFKACIRFSRCYSANRPEKDLSLMTMRCHFILSSIYVELGRQSSNNQVDQRQRYLEARMHVDQYCGILETFVVRNSGSHDRLSSNLPEKVQRQILLQTSILYVFGFEAAVALKEWHRLLPLVQSAIICSDAATYKAMGDCLLRSQAPAEVVSSVVKQIVNQIYILETFDASRLAKYIRCLFQIVLPRGGNLAMQLLDQGIQLARELEIAGNPFPPQEIAWLIATSFNYAVDLYVEGDYHQCKEWASRAIELASYAGDDGRHKKAVESRFSELVFDQEIP